MARPFSSALSVAEAFVVREGRLLLVREAEGERFWLATQPGSGPA